MRCWTSSAKAIPTSRAPCEWVSARGHSRAIAPRRCESSARAIPRTSSARPCCSGIWRNGGAFGRRYLLIEIFRIHRNTGRGPQRDGRHLGLGRNQRDAPSHRNARFGFHDRTDMSGDRRPVRGDGCCSAVELSDAETTDFLLVVRLKRKHGYPPVLTSLSPFKISHV